jgi:hypothetical protein
MEANPSMKLRERSREERRRRNATQVTLIGYNLNGRVVKTVTVYHCDYHSPSELVFIFHPERNGIIKGGVLQTRPVNAWEGRLGCMACHRIQQEPFLSDLGRVHRWSWKAVERSYKSWAAKNKASLNTLSDDDVGFPETVTDYSHLTPAQLPSHIERPLPDD